ncbi:hypothetical protein JG687_00005495 [Phytophthora cactorum]|uniref:Uncharacterized protein n=2 Tax=Phytophthora TaxID=4783 RepID=A0A8J5IPK0_9STRA|nr:hypothetical protein GQ600_13757 [Phytophthora cactorum]KAG6965320.1 hypothetical protein JG687_00005495 [Phytophthora cactorum]KAG6968866.1 hypothetical protein JG688_00005600 [Phytophthora aleatoria]
MIRSVCHSTRIVIFSIMLAAELGANLWLLLDNWNVINDAFELLPIPAPFRWKLLGHFVENFAACVSWELIATRD